jgi:ferrous iron transport protein B
VRSPDTAPLRIDYGPEVEEVLTDLERRLDDHPMASTLPAPSRWLAVELLVGDPDVIAAVADPVLVTDARAAAEALEERTGLDAEALVADRRYEWIHGVAEGVVERTGPEGPTWSDRLDGVLTHRIWGIPIFFAVMWVVFKIVTDVSAPFVDWVDGTIAGPVTGWFAAILAAVGLGGTWVEAVVLDGIVAGVGAVLVFVPILVFLYVLLSILEDSGYMARAAFVMDRVMLALGLHGRSFLPLLVGFGCNIPAVYATRVLEHRRDRVLTSLLVPFVSCAARLPVFVLLAAIFFGQHQGNVVFAMYVTSVVFVLGIGFVLSRTVFRGSERAPFVMELPPYRWPTMGSTLRVMGQRVLSFLRKAGTIILAASIVVWLLLAVPARGDGSFNDTPIEDSAFATVSDGIAPAFAPAGFGSWELSGSLITGFVAKEVVIATLGQVYGLEEDEGDDGGGQSVLADVGDIAGSFGTAAKDAALALPRLLGVDFAESEEPDSALAGAIRSDFEDTSGGHGALAAMAFMLFVLLYVPCMATVGALRHELGARWTLFSVVLNTAVAWLVATLVFQVGRALGLG